MKYEYRIEKFSGLADEKWLNELGAEGWELVAIDWKDREGLNTAKRFVFKRALPQ